MSLPERASGLAASVEALLALHADSEQSAVAAGLRYVSADEPGLSRRRCGRGFAYLGTNGRPVDAATRDRIRALAIPPAWREVWICPDPDGHLLATGLDDRGRRQYLYHDRWRAMRDLINFYRLLDVGDRLTAIRAYVDKQLRRRTLDEDVMVATMIRIMDRCGLRVGNEVYAEENDTIGLCTLTHRHVVVSGEQVRFCFPAKSGKQADATLDDPAVARVVRQLLQRKGRRLFRVNGSAVTADAVNQRLCDLSDGTVTAKDFRTWRGTVVAFSVLRKHLPPGDDRDQRVLEAIDAAAAALGNTRAVARSHYVHPHVVERYLDGSFESHIAEVAAAGLSADERALLGFLESLWQAAEQIPIAV